MFLLIGIAAGALTGVPIGPVNVAVIDAAYRHTLRRAIAVGIGGAIADGLYAALGLVGVAPILNRYELIKPILFAVSGVVLLIYGFFTARSQPVAPATDSSGSQNKLESKKEMREGFFTGLLLIILNPAAIVTWVVIMSTIIPEPTLGNGIACAIGVMVGSFGWFALVAYLTQKGKSVLGEKAAWIPRLVGIALMVYSVYLLVKAVKFFLVA
jgi:threonine/homoserine/homoserine lactone efflux protein